ncbi:TPA: MBL fold metallo-hydrolase [Streptococcus suis]
MLKVFHKVVGLAQENTYVVVRDNQDALVFDPGDKGKALIDWIDSNGWQPKAILLTHAHFDHIGACDALRDRYDIPVYVYYIEQQWLMDGALNGSQSLLRQPITQAPADHVWQASDLGRQVVEGFEFEIYHVPGHSPGHVVYHFPSDHLVISGDTLFRDSIGRTDLQDGDLHSLLAGIKNHLLVLDEETMVYPGHGDPTTIKREKRLNPYLQVFNA